MTARRLVWSAGVVVAVLALGAAVVVASALPAGYDFRAYWLAGQHLLNGSPLYPGPDTILGLPDEFRYLPIVAILFVPFPLRPWASRSSAGSRRCGGRGRPRVTSSSSASSSRSRSAT